MKVNAKLTPAQHQAALMLAMGSTKTDAAKAVDVSPCTIYEWLKDCRFTALVNQERESILSQVRDKARQQACMAIDILGNLLLDEEPKIRLEAAKTLLATLKPFNAPDCYDPASLGIDHTPYDV